MHRSTANNSVEIFIESNLYLFSGQFGCEKTIRSEIESIRSILSSQYCREEEAMEWV
jgi:hypothetical protein